MLLPGFDTSIDLTGIRDRFAAFLSVLQPCGSLRSPLAYLLTAATRGQVHCPAALMAKAPEVVSPALTPVEAVRRRSLFVASYMAELGAARQLLDEAKIELTLSISPQAVRGSQLEVMATEASFAAFLLVGLNERKLRALASGDLGGLQPILQPVDENLTQNFTALARPWIPSNPFPHQRRPSPSRPPLRPSAPIRFCSTNPPPLDPSCDPSTKPCKAVSSGWPICTGSFERFPRSNETNSQRIPFRLVNAVIR